MKSDETPAWISGFDDLTQKRYHAAPATLLPQQRMLFALLEGTFRRTKKQPLAGLPGWFIGVVMAGVIIGAATYAIVMCVCLATGWLPTIIGEPIIWLCAAIVFGISFELRRENRDTRIKASDRHIDLSGLSYNDDGPYVMGWMFLGMLCGSQAAHIRWSPTHMYLRAEKFEVENTIRITLDNVLYSVSDFFELYGISLEPLPEHTVWSATAFLIYRLAFGAMLLLIVWSTVKRWRARRMFAGYPRESKYSNVTHWLRSLSGSESSWMLSQFDEYIFLRICGEYLAGNFDAVTRLTRTFPRLRIESSTRTIFVDPHGKRLFEGYQSR